MKKYLAVIALGLLVVGCTAPMSKGGFAFINETTQTDIATSNTAVTKSGKACQKNILSIVASGDSSLTAAMKAGNITRLAYADTSVKNMIVYAEVCTIAYGN